MQRQEGRRVVGMPRECEHLWAQHATHLAGQADHCMLCLLCCPPGHAGHSRHVVLRRQLLRQLPALCTKRRLQQLSAEGRVAHMPHAVQPARAAVGWE